MLFPFLEHLGANRFNDLTFPLQMHIASFIPNLPRQTTLLLRVLRAHLEMRYCESCGRVLPISPMRRRTFYCLCQRRYYRQKYHSPLRRYVVYKRPFFIFSSHEVSFSFLHTILSRYKGQMYYIACNQPGFCYSLKPLLDTYSLHLIVDYVVRRQNMAWMLRYYLPRVVNTNTCLRSYTDSFVQKPLAAIKGVHTHRYLGRLLTKNYSVRGHGGFTRAPSLL